MTLLHRLIAAPFWPLCAAYRLLSCRRRVRRAREVKAAAVRDHLPDAGEMVGASVTVGDVPAELVSFDLKLPAGIPECEAYLWN